MVSITCNEYCNFAWDSIWEHACSVVSNSVTPWTVASQGPLTMGFPRQKYWSELAVPTPGGLLFPTRGSNPHLPGLLLWQADSWPLCYVGSPGNVVSLVNYEPSPRMPLRSSSTFYSSCSWTHLLWGNSTVCLVGHLVHQSLSTWQQSTTQHTAFT